MYILFRFCILSLHWYTHGTNSAGLDLCCVFEPHMRKYPPHLLPKGVSGLKGGTLVKRNFRANQQQERNWYEAAIRKHRKGWQNLQRSTQTLYIIIKNLLERNISICSCYCPVCSTRLGTFIVFLSSQLNSHTKGNICTRIMMAFGYRSWRHDHWTFSLAQQKGLCHLITSFPLLCL